MLFVESHFKTRGIFIAPTLAVTRQRTQRQEVLNDIYEVQEFMATPGCKIWRT